MRKGLVCVFVAAVVIFSLGTATVSAACKGGKGCYTDIDGNGTCDNYENGDCVGHGGCLGIFGRFSGLCKGKFNHHLADGSRVGSNYGSAADSYDAAGSNYGSAGSSYGSTGSSYDCTENCRGDASGDDCYVTERHNGHGRGKHNGCKR